MNSTLEFQIYDSVEDHEMDTDDILGNYIIHTFGRCENGQSVYAKIINYTPSFYILLPDELQVKTKSYLDHCIKKIESYMKSKDNKKIYYKYKPTLKEINIIKLKKAEGFTNNIEYYFAILTFTNYEGMKKYKYYFENNDISIPGIIELSKSIRFKLYQANLPPMLRCFHIREISGCSWVETSVYDIIDDDKESRCDIEIKVDWRYINPIKKNNNAPLRICSFDIECNSIDGALPQAIRPGDTIIQIGATYTYLGESKPYRQYIACLHTTSDIDGVIVETCDDEKELLYAFLNEINENDCDIMTGYNIFYFDEKYIYDRSKYILNIDNNMAYMSKLINYKCEFKEMKLASSALGENLLRFWNTPGRIHIDLMKDIQKSEPLTCYTLNYVSSYFIRENIKSYTYLGDNIYELECNKIQNIQISDFINIEIMSGFITNVIKNKYLILNILNNKMTIKGDLIEPNQKLCWSQAKDDLEAKDIFKLQKGSPKDRALIAKYCIKDCKLVNMLIDKLEIVTKNIEMANVCFVPLSYLFIRGQGIKVFSLCLKEFRKQKYAFPVIKMNMIYQCLRCKYEYSNSRYCPKCNFNKREDVETISSSYEGAIVFDPVPNVYYEAIAVKDYMSLYPSSIIHKNMSHETIVENPAFDNLKGITYYNAQYKESDGSIQYRRFAQLNNELGVIPTILDNLLKERKNIKNLMKNEKDAFKYKILDAKQYALKITANSLYGQLGAPTSPICKRDIAACTTSTGREMLLLAKKYDEEILSLIINGLKYMYNNDNINEVNKLYDLELKARHDEKLINEIKEFVTIDIKNIILQPVVRYGDSVIGKTPLLLKSISTNNIFITSIDKLADTTKYMLLEKSYKDEEINTFFKRACEKSLFQHNTISDLLLPYNKQYVELSDILIWTETGWTKIYRVIRHKLNNKKLYRITTHSGSVVVTEDHSLITHDNIEISPNQLAIGMKLLHNFPEGTSSDIIINEKIISDDIEALNYYYLAKQNNINMNVDYKNGNYILTPCEDINYSITKIEIWTQEEEYVYDLTTENHHFHAGVGSLIVHNTDSIFTCYSFRENTILLPKSDALKIWKKVVSFAKVLIEPFFNYEELSIFNDIFDKHYSVDKIIDMKLPPPPICLPLPDHNNIILPLEERIKIFIKDYMEESYLPWLWTLSENKANLIQWAEHLLLKVKITAQNLYENRKTHLIVPIMKEINIIFTNKYIKPTQEIINSFSEFIIGYCKKTLGFMQEDQIDNFSKLFLNDNKKIKLLCKTLLEKTIKEKWIFSEERKELIKSINEYTSQIVISDNDSLYKLTYFINDFLLMHKNLNVNKTTELLISNLLNDKDMNIIFNEENIDMYTKNFIEKYYKNCGKKTMEQIIEDFLEKDLEINFNNDNDIHSNKVNQFINTHLRRQDMSQMEIESYIYYYIQPRWNKNKEVLIDIYEGGNSILDNRSVKLAITLGKLSGELIKSRLPHPHDCEYEKVYYPLGLVKKKGYVGNKFVFDMHNYKLDFMGIALKRRDNAPIVKEIYNGIIDYLINQKNPKEAINYTKICINKMFNGEYNMKYFLQSKKLKLKESYKNWERMAHVYLADKITKRDPGNILQSGDRIEYAYIKVPPSTNGKKLLQGDIIETPEYIIEHELEIDYLFYLTNQIMNPILQFLELVDKNAKQIFDDFIEKYSSPKIKKIKEIKEKEKEIKSKIIKNKSQSITKILKTFKVTKIISESLLKLLINFNKNYIIINKQLNTIKKKF
jgi:DNA polymerase elongation subunit (family B)